MSRRYRSFRGELGSILYRIIYLSLIFLGLKYFDITKIFNDIVLALLGIISFELTGFILRKMGVWR